MTGRTRLILVIVLTLVACALLYFFFVKPQRARLADVKLEIQAEQSRTGVLQAELQRLQDLQANAPKLQAELAQIRGYVPEKPELSNLIFQVQEASNRAGLDFVQITPELPEPPPEGASLAQVRATIGASGGYFALQDFMRRLYALDRALRADTLSITVQSLAPYGTRLQADMAIRVFYELPTDPAAPATAAAPGTTPAPSPTTTP